MQVTTDKPVISTEEKKAKKYVCERESITTHDHKVWYPAAMTEEQIDSLISKYPATATFFKKK